MKIWIYTDGEQKGPFSPQELLGMNISPTTPVWFEGMAKWMPAGQVDEMQPILRGELPAEETPKEEHVAETIVEEPVNNTEATKIEETIQHEEAEVEREEMARLTPGMAATHYRDLPSEPCPATYIGWSIFLTICCCSPLSVGALIASILVTSFYNKGKLAKSRRASEVAAWLIMIAIALGFFPLIIMYGAHGN